jgi:hypothetical protein
MFPDFAYCSRAGRLFRIIRLAGPRIDPRLVRIIGSNPVFGVQFWLKCSPERLIFALLFPDGNSMGNEIGRIHGSILAFRFFLLTSLSCAEISEPWGVTISGREVSETPVAASRFFFCISSMNSLTNAGIMTLSSHDLTSGWSRSPAFLDLPVLFAITRPSSFRIPCGFWTVST